MKRYLAAASVALTMSFAGIGQASVTTYTNEADWIAAVGFYDNEPFDAGGPQSFTGVTTTPGHGVIGPARVNLSGSVWEDSLRWAARGAIDWRGRHRCFAGEYRAA